MAHGWYTDGGTRRSDWSTGIFPIPFSWPANTKVSCESIFYFLTFFCSLHYHCSPSAWLMVMAWCRLLAALPPRAGKELWPRGQNSIVCVYLIIVLYFITRFKTKVQSVSRAKHKWELLEGQCFCCKHREENRWRFVSGARKQ